jgi:hypothetical protein
VTTEPQPRLSDADRLLCIENILALLPATKDWQGRASNLAYLIASRSDQALIQSAAAELEAVRPNWLRRVKGFYERDKERAGV